MSFLHTALTLTEFGYAALPLTPNGKTPICKHGCNDGTTNIDTIQEWAAQQPDANVGIHCTGLVVIDLDEKDGKHGIADIEEVISELGPLPKHPVVTTPTGGRHLYFKASATAIKNAQGLVWQGRKTGIDIRTDGGYVVAPGSATALGSYTGHLPPIQELPELPDLWVKRFLPHRTPQTPPVALPVFTPDNTAADRCRAYVAAMPPAIQGQQGHSALLKVANAIFHGFGLSESEGWPIMLEYNARCVPPWDLSDPKQERDFRRKMNQARDKPTSDYPFGFYRPMPVSTKPDVDISAIEKQCRDLTQNTPPMLAFGETIPNELTSVPGFINTFIDFCMQGAPHPNRPLAFGGALALMAFLTIRKVETVDGVRPNLYVIAIAGSGTGKDYARTVIEAILNATGQGHLVGKEIASAEGIEDKILCNKKMIFLTDEIDNLFKNIASGKESRYTNTVSLLLSMFTSAGSIWYKRTKAASAQKSITPDTCHQPGLILFGTATPNAFLNALTPDMLTTGLGSRCMILEGEPRSRTNHNSLKPDQMPKALIDAAEFWRDFVPVDPETGKPPNLYHENPIPRVVPMTDEAQDIGRRFCEFADDQYDETDNALEKVMWSRVYEIAKKLSLLYACSRDHENPVIDGDAAQWGCQASEWLFNNLIQTADEKVAENTFDALCQKIMQAIKTNRGTITRQQLIRTIRIKARELDEALVTLLQSDQIEAEIYTGTTKPTITYTLTKTKS